jgi:hypothetical protein
MSDNTNNQRSIMPMYRKPGLMSPSASFSLPKGAATGEPAQAGPACAYAAEGHCLTCADEARPARVLRVDEETGIAVVLMDMDPTLQSIASESSLRQPGTSKEDTTIKEDATLEVDISLIEDVAPGDLVLVHGGIALERYDLRPE